VTRLPLTLCLALAWFFAINLFVSAAVAAACAWRRARHARGAEGPMSGPLALTWRLLPAASGVAVAGIFVPAFLSYEPAVGPEPVGWTLRLAAGATIVLAAGACGRGVLLARRARALEARWQASAAPIDLHDLSGTRIRAYAVHDRFPIVALVGLWRPRLFIAGQVLSALNTSELRVAVAHELAHQRARDNAKRAILAWTPDLLGWLNAGRLLERQWAAAAERDADRSAAGESRSRRIDLAGALVKVTRLASAPAPAIPLFSTFHECGDIGDRVRRLVVTPAGERNRRVGRLALVAAVALVAAAPLPPTWQALHAISEMCVRSLP
jgi:Zn-dependent protease with chaperone function